MKRALLLASLALALAPLPARADSIGPCPEGERVVTNPTPAGSMHHGGFHCEPDPSASRCSALPGAREGDALGLVLLGVAGLVLASRRR